MELSRLLILLLLACLNQVSFAGKDKKALASGTKEKAVAVIPVVEKVVSGINEIIKQADKAKLLESVTNILGAAPVFGSLVAAVINCVLAFIPQTNPVLEEMKKQFNEVNRKLDSMSLQISSLHTEVQWASYASIYSQDESNIRNSWDKYLEYFESSLAAETEEEKMRMAERFTTFYEGTATESSVASLYSYLTVTQPTLKINLLDIIIKRFKGDVEFVMIYGIYFRNLLFQGYQMNLVYYSLKGFQTDSLAKKATIEFQTASEAIEKAGQECFDHYNDFMKQDVNEIGSAQSLEPSRLAAEIKTFLDKKYDWYDWIVVGFQIKEKTHIKFSSNFAEFVFDDISVAVSHSVKGKNIKMEKDIQNTIDKCIVNIECSSKTIIDAIGKCLKEGKVGPWGQVIPIEDAVAGFYFFEKTQYRSEYPASNITATCKKEKGFISVYSHSEEKFKPIPCPECISGTCTQLLETPIKVCKCNPKFYGSKCNQNLMEEVEKSQKIEPLPYPVPDHTMIYRLLKAPQAQKG